VQRLKTRERERKSLSGKTRSRSGAPGELAVAEGAEADGMGDGIGDDTGGVAGELERSELVVPLASVLCANTGSSGAMITRKVIKSTAHLTLVW
jgi:hypothetical protein